MEGPDDYWPPANLLYQKRVAEILDKSYIAPHTLYLLQEITRDRCTAHLQCPHVCSSVIERESHNQSN